MKTHNYDSIKLTNSNTPGCFKTGLIKPADHYIIDQITDKVLVTAFKNIKCKSLKINYIKQPLLTQGLFLNSDIDILDLSDLKTGSPINELSMIGWFKNTTINQLYLPKNQKLSDLTNAFNGANIQYINFKDIDMTLEQYYHNTFKNATIKELILNNPSIRPKFLEHTFKNATIQHLDIRNINTEQLTEQKSTFKNSKITSVIYNKNDKKLNRIIPKS